MLIIEFGAAAAFLALMAVVLWAIRKERRELAAMRAATTPWVQRPRKEKP